MNNTTKADIFRDVFKNSLRVIARSLSVETLLSDRNLKRIKYDPYYQRNYVWDVEKQSFFIESVILGTEIPPLILFKTGNKVEVIDGRQRFETLKKFKENDITLSPKGLRELLFLGKKSFNKLEDKHKYNFLESNIRVFEFEVMNHPNLSEDILDKVKKEIFRRYNTGITPLTRDELDSAKYDSDSFSELFKEKLKNDFKFLSDFNRCFFPNIVVSKDDSNADIISKNIEFIRRYRILNKFPISTYAGSSNRTAIIDILYELANENTVNIEHDFNELLNVINDVLSLYSKLGETSLVNNKLIFETILWASSILKSEDITYNVDVNEYVDYFTCNFIKYNTDNSHYYKNIIERYSATANFFFEKTGFCFSQYIRDTTFSKKIASLRENNEDELKSIEELETLRLHKPNPTSIPVDEIRTGLRTTKYLLRPSYQRQEKINQLKASSIIESILLGITLPPIFVYKKTNGVKEVIDGQQRLLSIIGFLGDEFLNENGKLTRSKNNNFKLKGLKILTSLEGARYNDLEEHLQDKLLDFVIDVVVIDEAANATFDPIDLFIRLNYKPYPIKPNSFEMWNSVVDPEVVKKIKNISKSEFSSWFFLRDPDQRKADRMLNEELITTLSYIFYKKDEEVIGLFPRKETITCRLKDKKGLSLFLTELDNTAVEKQSFLKAIDSTKDIIESLSILLDDVSKEGFNKLLNVKGAPIYRRTLQDFYVIWMVIMHLDSVCISKNKDIIYSNIQELLKMRLNVNNENIDENYMEVFSKTLMKTKELKNR
ncbi:hypothetical protein DA099_12760 [Photobacterium damselae]|uniref:Uncharacterized protein n=1 Tax=Photobacterium damselae TaxID=38293 RepID=A0ACD3T197_PHODM|nr:DUF262 domain-containing protein [Photobacterium damselae]RDL28606.1 hypothetical protein BC461_16170 [Photobacterium damselae]TMX48141.1 hypothetical protein DA099_12760 [Photobacterium damselae]TMX64954.1 hypothetical protein DA090_13290 [Photobacterium damselae]TMX78005.1 hypothetical protein DA092_03735 [Photobacterium damselae]